MTLGTETAALTAPTTGKTAPPAPPSALKPRKIVVPKVNHVSIAVVAVVSFIASGFYYSVIFAETWTALADVEGGSMTLSQIAAQLLRDLVVTYVLARMIILAGARGPLGALELGLWIWFGFQSMAVAGSVIHEGYSWQLFAIHTGDALMKTTIASLILGAWPRRDNKEA